MLTEEADDKKESKSSERMKENKKKKDTPDKDLEAEKNLDVMSH